MIDNNSNYNKKFYNLLNKFIKKVKEDDKNYNNIKFSNQNYLKKIKINNIFLDNNEIFNITTIKIKQTLNLAKDLNDFLKSNDYLSNYFLKKIVFFKFSINENNINNFLTSNYNNFNEFYKLLFVNFNIINNNLYIIDKNNNINNSLNIDNYFFLDDLDTIYLFFEKKEIYTFSCKSNKILQSKILTKKKVLPIDNKKKTKKLKN